jgi:hypothetical protein
MIHRGVQYSRQSPNSSRKLDATLSPRGLENTNNIRFLPNATKNPITGRISNCCVGGGAAHRLPRARPNRALGQRRGPGRAAGMGVTLRRREERRSGAAAMGAAAAQTSAGNPLNPAANPATNAAAIPDPTPAQAGSVSQFQASRMRGLPAVSYQHGFGGGPIVSVASTKSQASMSSITRITLQPVAVHLHPTRSRGPDHKPAQPPLQGATPVQQPIHQAPTRLDRLPPPGALGGMQVAASSARAATTAIIRR